MNDFIIFLAVIGGLAMAALLIWTIVAIVQECREYLHGDTRKQEADFKTDVRGDLEYIISKLRTLFRVCEQYNEMLSKQIAELKEKDEENDD